MFHFDFFIFTMVFRFELLLRKQHSDMEILFMIEKISL